MRPGSHTVIRILAGILLLAMSALPAIVMVSEVRHLKDLLCGIRELEKFFGNRISAWALSGFLACVPLLGLYLITESIASMIKRKRRQ
ncbi:MAG: hypothetical protein A2283_07405 [Lentisphaerae bacterium RIFOXYA12_FULL_48_11]|nr:MAG: hypothetical protein A2283_07405 [Lentisphaerae bacterium RIFOXYA12_FULL_48_11]